MWSIISKLSISMFHLLWYYQTSGKILANNQVEILSGGHPEFLRGLAMLIIFKRLSLCLIALIELSCSSSQYVRQSYQMEPFSDRPRIFYGEKGDSCESSRASSENCEELTLEELNQIQQFISDRTQNDIWFIRVPLMTTQGNRSNLWVYLAPDITNTRLRSGWAYTITAWSTSIGPYVSEPWRYAQISLLGKEFSPILETPEVHDLPFQYPAKIVDGSKQRSGHMSQKELIRIIDYTRNSNIYFEYGDRKEVTKEQLSDGRTRTRIQVLTPRPEKMAKVAISQPVISIRKGKDEIRVSFGFHHNGLFGRGSTVWLKVTKEGYEIIKWGEWVS